MANESDLRVRVRGGWFGNINDGAGGWDRDRGWYASNFVVLPFGKIVIAVALQNNWEVAHVANDRIRREVLHLWVVGELQLPV